MHASSIEAWSFIFMEYEPVVIFWERDDRESDLMIHWRKELSGS